MARSFPRIVRAQFSCSPWLPKNVSRPPQLDSPAIAKAFHATARTAPRKAKAPKYVYTWGNNKADGDGSMKPLLGGKGANLAEMTRIGLPVPPGFTITTEVCTYYYAHKRTYPPDAPGADREAGVANMEKIMGTKFGDTTKMPLLVAVRSGARDSMPGMMDTILNLGLNDETVHRARRTRRRTSASPGTATAASSRCMATSCIGVQKREGEDHEPFETVIARATSTRRTTEDIEDAKLTADDYKELVDALQEAREGAHRARRSRTIRGSSSRARPAPCSARG